MGIEFRILGPLEVRLEGVPIRIGGARQRALLAMLLLSANRVVSRDRLIEELLGDTPPETADHALRVQVSRLRKVLEPESGDSRRLVARTPGYLLRVDRGELDLQIFEELLAEGHRALEEQAFERASRTLHEAESLWRGHPLADLEFEPFARIDIDRLEELRLVTAEERIDAELALGRHGMLVAELESLVAERPLRERLRAQLMLSLYRSGRQADALEAYRAGRTLLNEELALEPGPALRDLERSILRQEPVLELSNRAPGEVAIEVLAPPDPPPRGPRAVDHGDQGPRARQRKRRVVLEALALAVAVVVIAAVAVAASGSRTLSATANSVAVISTNGDALAAVIPVGGPPGGIAAGAGEVWETDTADDQVLEIDPASRNVERIAVGDDPTGVAVGGGEVWVVNQLDRTVSEINPQALRQVASFQVGNGAAAIAFGDGSVWVANATDDTISRINPGTGAIATIPLAGQPGGIAIGSDGVWITSASTGQLLLIDPQTDQVTQEEEIGGSPTGVAVGAGSVWVANTAEATVSRFDPDTGTVTEVNAGKAPVGVAFGDGAVWVANSLAGTVARIDPSSDSVRLVRLGGAPTALAIYDKRIWATVLPGPAAHRGGTLTVNEDGPQFEALGSSLDPAGWSGGLSQWQMLALTNDGLVTYRRVGGLAGSTLVPDLATSLPAPTDNGLTYTFQLRSGVRYSTGAPIRPEDFRHEIERVLQLDTIGSGYAQSFYMGIVGAQQCIQAPKRCTLTNGIVTDDQTNTVTFHLIAPDPDFLYKLAFPWADAVPADTPERDLGRSMPPATGPYMTQSITSTRAFGQYGEPLAFHTWTLVRNPRFHEWSAQAQPPGYPAKIVLSQGENPQRAVDDVERGSLDVLLPAPANRLGELAVHYTNQFHSEPYGATFSLMMNTRTPPFNRVSVRQALNFAIDRNQIVGFAGGPLAAHPTCQILPPTMEGYQPYCPYTRDPNAGGSWSAPDLARARQLVAASGTRGMKVTLLVLKPDAADPTMTVGPYIVSILDQLGYRASLRVLGNPYPVLGDSRDHVQLGWFPWIQDYPAPPDFIGPLFTCRAFLPGSPNNINESEFCDPKIDAEIQSASSLQALAPGTASETWRAIDQQITDQAPSLPLYNPRNDIATSSRVGNYQYHTFFVLLFDQLWVR